MGTCITVIKVVGASSLGLLSGNLAFQSYKRVPELIRQLNNQVSISSTQAVSVLRAVTNNIYISTAANVLFASLTTYLFSTAYKYSPPSGRHPYLLYCAVGAPLALASYVLQARSADVKIVKRAGLQQKHVEGQVASRSDAATTAPAAAHATEPAPAQANEDSDGSLGKSYIHVSDSSSSSSTPSTTSPNSPQQQATDIHPATSAIEQEVEEALSKKEYINNLETVKKSYKTAFTISSAAFVVSAIGLVGDFFFI
ncbi:hypothetical protein FDK38_001272 [Candidozyma auris]|nr:hypothetical protein FDK38_001272 [[Candida] auris]